MGLIWFDITDVMEWWRPPVGVIRAQVEIGTRLSAKLGAEVAFCKFASHRFEQVPREAFEGRIAVLQRSDLARLRRPRSGVKRLQAAYGYVLNNGPTAVHEPLRLLVRLAKSHTRIIKRSAARRRKGTASPGEPAVSSRSILPPPFVAGDVYVSIGADWDFPDKTNQIGVLRAGGVRTTLFCYDLIPYLFPHIYGVEKAASFTKYLCGALGVADAVLCISENTKRDLCALIDSLGAPKPRISTLRLGSDNVPALPTIVPAVAPRFIVYVSSLDRRKNHEILYKAYILLREKYETAPPQCVLVGMPSATASETMSDITLDPRIKCDFLILTSASDGEVLWLYENCLYTVFPSLYEGWGLPIAESLSHGKLVLAADTSSIREVGGNLVEYLDPWDVNAWSDRLMYFAENSAARGQREAAIRRSYAGTMWADTVAALVGAIEQVQEKHTAEH